MDLLPWRSLNKFVGIHHTKSKFYNRYLYKVRYNLIGAHLISAYKDKEFPLYMSQKFSAKEIEKLSIFIAIFRDKTLDLRWRSEGSSLSIFGRSEQELYDLANDRLRNYRSSLVSVTRVANEEDLVELEAGKILMSKPTQYRYRVTVREGWRSVADRQNLGKYITSIRSEVKISDFLLQGMINQYKYLHSCYFYVNDPKIVSMIALVAPNVVKRVQEVVVR